MQPLHRDGERVVDIDDVCPVSSRLHLQQSVPLTTAFKDVVLGNEVHGITRRFAVLPIARQLGCLIALRRPCRAVARASLWSIRLANKGGETASKASSSSPLHRRARAIASFGLRGQAPR